MRNVTPQCFLRKTRWIRHEGCRFLLCALLGIVFPAAGAEKTQSRIDTLESLVSELVALRKEKSRAQTTWRSQRESLEAGTAVLAADRDRLKTRTADIDAELTTLQDERAKHRERMASIEERLLSFSTAVQDVTAVLRRMSNRLPPPLAADITPMLRRLEAMPPTLDNLGGRYSRILEIFSAVEAFDNDLHSRSLVLTGPDGVAREMKVLCVGLSSAYAVSLTGSHAAVGRPSDTSWEWHWESRLAPAVTRAVAMYGKNDQAGFVDLPMRVKGAAE